MSIWNKLDTVERFQIISALVESCSIRAMVLMTGASKNTIAKLLVELGAVCTAYIDNAMRNLPASGFSVIKFRPCWLQVEAGNACQTETGYSW